MDQLIGQLFSVLPRWIIYIIIYGFAVYLTYYCSAIAVAYQDADCEYGWIPSWKSGVSKNHLLSRTMIFLTGSLRGFIIEIALLTVYVKIAGIDIRSQRGTLSAIHSLSSVAWWMFCTLVIVMAIMIILVNYNKSERARNTIVRGIELNLKSRVSSMTGWLGFIHPFLLMVMLDFVATTAPESEDLTFLLVFVFPLILVVFDVNVEKVLRNSVTEVKIKLDSEGVEYIYLGEDASTVFLIDPERPDMVLRKNLSAIEGMTFSKKELFVKKE